MVHARSTTTGPTAPTVHRGPGPRWEIALVTTWFAVLAVLAEYFPRTGDDWAWGTSEGTDRLRHFFAGLNGRYGGSMLVLGLVRSGPFAALVVAAIICASLVLILHLADNRTPLGYGLLGTLFLAMPLGTWREAVVWLSGFVNYAVGAAVMLGFLALARAEWFERLRPAAPARLALVVIAGFLGQLFIEHVTICICVLGTGLSLLYRRARGRWPAYLVTWTVAGFGGAALMFSNSAYRHAASDTTGTYQSVQSISGKGATKHLAIKLLDYLPTQAVVGNVVLNGVLVVLLIALVIARGRLRTAAGRAVAILALAFLALTYGLLFTERHEKVREPIRALAIVAAVLLVAVVVLAAAALIDSAQRRWTVNTAAAAAVFLVGPLLFVNPVGARCFYPSYAVLLVIVSVFAGELRDRLPAFGNRALSLPLHLSTAVLMTVMLVVYVTISHAIDRRLAHIHAGIAAGDSVVLITPLPHPYYAHNGDPFWSLLQMRFEAYYGLPADVTVRLSPNPWLRVPGKPAPLPQP